MQQVSERLTKGVEESVAEEAREANIDIVSDMFSGRVLYSSNKADCTAEIVNRMDKKYEQKLAQAKKATGDSITVAAKKDGAVKTG